MPWPWDDEEDNEDFSRSGGGSDTWATQEELRDEYRRSMQEPEETPVEPWEEAYGGSERDLPGFTESSNAIPDPRRQPGPPETMGGRPGAVDPPGYFQGRQSPEAAAPRAPQIFNQRGGQWVEQTDQPSAADLRALTEDPFGATARRLRDRWREQEGVSARERQRLEWDGATQEERARQEVREMTAEMPITQRDRIQMQRLSNEIARISDLADSNTITSTVAAAAIARRGAQLTDLRQRETDERTRTESEERQRASRLQQAAILQQAGWTAEAAVIFDEVANRGRPRTPSGDIAHRDEQGAVIGHSVPAENGQRQFVPAQGGEGERRSESQQRLQIADERQIATIEDRVNREMDRREDNYRSQLRAWEDRVAAIRRDARERQVTVQDQDLPPPPRADAWIHDPDRRDAEFYRRLTRSLSLTGRSLPTGYGPAPQEPVVGPQRPAAAPQGEAAPSAGAAQAPAARQGPPIPQVQAVTGEVAQAVLQDYSRRISDLPAGERSTASALLTRARRLWEEYGARMPPPVIQEYADLSRRIDEQLMRSPPVPAGAGPAIANAIQQDRAFQGR